MNYAYCCQCIIYYNTDMSLHAYFDASTECKQLRSIVLLNVKRVSDVGIRCIASCQHLEALNGMYVFIYTY